jgi:hypothetical protein
VDAACPFRVQDIDKHVKVLAELCEVDAVSSMEFSPMTDNEIKEQTQHKELSGRWKRLFPVVFESASFSPDRKIIIVNFKINHIVDTPTSWQYSWRGCKHKQNVRHVLLATIYLSSSSLRRTTANSWADFYYPVMQRQSPSFVVVSNRRNMCNVQPTVSPYEHFDQVVSRGGVVTVFASKQSQQNKCSKRPKEESRSKEVSKSKEDEGQKVSFFPYEIEDSIITMNKGQVDLVDTLVNPVSHIIIDTNDIRLANTNININICKDIAYLPKDYPLVEDFDASVPIFSATAPNASSTVVNRSSDIFNLPPLSDEVEAKVNN